MNDFIYEVTVSLPAENKERVMRYMLDKHINDVLKHGAFSSAWCFPELSSNSERFSFTTHYLVKNQPLFQDYQNTYAKQMRSDFLEQFGEANPAITRRLLSTPIKVGGTD